MTYQFEKNLSYRHLKNPVNWLDVMKQQQIGWVSLSQMREFGALSLLMMACIFLRRVIWPSLREYKLHWIPCYEKISGSQSGMQG